MKKTLLTGLLLSAFATMAQADPITLAQARALAKNYLPAGSVPSLVKRYGASKSEAQTQSIYIFSRGAGQGFVAISGNDALPQVLGFTDTGDYDEALLPPMLTAMLGRYAEAADSLNRLGISATAPIRKAAGTKNITPLMTTHWHQSSPYNDQAPYLTGTTNRAATGCVATAASQILYYWRKDLDDRTKYATPTYGYGDAPVTESIPSGTPLKWDLMQDKYSGGEPAESRSAVATLMAVVGRSGWLTYGSSTGGQISDQINVARGQFGLNGGTVVWKSSYSQSTWEKMIVQDLELGRPIHYSGVNSGQGGHAVVVDGYRVSDNLFHFNFGWGGQGDGYWTVDDATGMNGFNESQGMVYQIYPAKPNVSGKLYLDADSLRSRMPNRITARITNNGTLPLQGLHLYALTGSSTPATAKSSQASDLTTSIATGETATIEFEYSPSGTSAYTLYLCDAQKNILDKIQGVGVGATTAQLTFHGLGSEASQQSEKIETEEGQVSVANIYSAKTTDIRATFTNGLEATNCQPSVKGMLYTLQDDGTWKLKLTKTKKTTTFAPGETADIVFDLTGLQEGIIYKFELGETASATRSSDIQFEADGTLYFQMKGADLSATASEDGRTLTLQGNYSASAFAALSQDESVCVYDLTQVSGVVAPLEAANPNALFYVSAESGAAGTNIIADGVCQQLALLPGYDFQPKGDFHAMEAAYLLNQSEGDFATAVLPFEADVPSGVMARRIAHFRGSTVSEADSCNLRMLACTPYVVLAAQPVEITAKNVTVSINVASEASDSIVGTFVNQIATAEQLILNKEKTQYFDVQTGTQIPALTAYVTAARKIRMSNTQTASKDTRARALAAAIAQAQQTLDAEEALLDGDFVALQQRVLEKANDALRSQPVAEEQEDMTTLLEELLSLIQYKVSDAERGDGYTNLTYLIQNPSYETGNSRGWTVSKTGINKIASSLANYVSGADGECVLRINAGGSASQTIEDVPDGIYTLSLRFAADEGDQLQVAAGKDTLVFTADDFGAMYMQEAKIEGIRVEDGELAIAAQGLDGVVKIDAWTLLQTEDLTDGINDIAAQPARKALAEGIYDLSGRRLAKAPESGIYIVNGRKIVK